MTIAEIIAALEQSVTQALAKAKEDLLSLDPDEPDEPDEPPVDQPPEGTVFERAVPRVRLADFQWPVMPERINDPVDLLQDMIDELIVGRQGDIAAGRFGTFGFTKPGGRLVAGGPWQKIRLRSWVTKNAGKPQQKVSLFQGDQLVKETIVDLDDNPRAVHEVAFDAADLPDPTNGNSVQVRLEWVNDLPQGADYRHGALEVVFAHDGSGVQPGDDDEPEEPEEPPVDPPPPTGKQPIRDDDEFRIYARGGWGSFGPLQAASNRMSSVAYAFPTQIAGTGTSDGNVDWSNVDPKAAAQRIYSGRIGEMRGKHNAVWLDIEGGNAFQVGWFYKHNVSADKRALAIKRRIQLIDEIEKKFRKDVPKVEVTDYDLPAAPHWNDWQDANKRKGVVDMWAAELPPLLQRLSFTGISAYLHGDLENKQDFWIDWQADMHAELVKIARPTGCKIVPTIWPRTFPKRSLKWVPKGFLPKMLDAFRDAGCHGVCIWHTKADLQSADKPEFERGAKEIMDWAAKNNVTRLQQW